MNVNVITLRIVLQPDAKTNTLTDWLNEELGGDLEKTVLDWGWTFPQKTLEVPDDYQEGDFLEA